MENGLSELPSFDPAPTKHLKDVTMQTGKVIGLHTYSNWIDLYPSCELPINEIEKKSPLQNGGGFYKALT